ncbi:hypothetical protein F2Q70_00012613 [Brassica cretica]|uniref:Uncharacterized protein n=1 Tax=Brassica cretica TaxID=69181 RepID=A0A8S9MCW6_BRACR|nr:hypothetical protein F2Q70_00012613 [Brassica cretica]
MWGASFDVTWLAWNTDWQRLTSQESRLGGGRWEIDQDLVPALVELKLSGKPDGTTNGSSRGAYGCGSNDT